MSDLDDSLSRLKSMRDGREELLGKIDQYELIRELGGGGFGTVYLAKDAVSKVEYAVKGLPPEVKNSTEEQERIRANFELVSRLSHTNIARAHVLHRAKSVWYASEEVRQKLRVMPGDTLMVMEYAPGATLSKWSVQFPEKKAPEEQALEIVRQIAGALDYAHEQRVIHRDVKPSNVMIETKKDGRLVARVLDFGLAAEIRSSMGRVSREVRDVSGTRPYMAPEQWLGEKQTAATDQYALAALCHELLTGEAPFASVFETGDVELMKSAVTKTPFAAPRELPRCIRAALEKALAKKPEERFASCGEFVDALAGRAKGKGGFKAFLAAACLAALAAGGIWFWQDRDAPTGTDTQHIPAPAPAARSTPAPVAAPAPVVPVSSARPETDGGAGGAGGASEAAKDAYIEAKVWMRQKLPNVADGDGFAARKEALRERFIRAEEQYKAGNRWSEAAAGFAAYTNDCARLYALDGERRAARGKREEEKSAASRAEEAEAGVYAKTRYEEARKRATEAENDFSQMKFAAASVAFAAAARQFDRCVDEAKSEKARLAKEEADRKAAEEAKAEAERKARLAAEAKRLYDGKPQTFTLPGGVQMEMVYVGPGSFQMGGESGEDDEKPVHQVRLTKGYWIGKYPVTQRQWAALVSANGVSFAKGAPAAWFSASGGGSSAVSGMDTSEFPMESVSWEDCDALVKALNRNEKGGRTWSLPTEAQWEFAARGGNKSRGYTYSGGDDLDALGWYYENSGIRRLDDSNWDVAKLGSNKCRTHSVREKDVGNELGIVGMSGNVWEWCYDWYDEDYYSRSPEVDPCNRASGGNRVLRGGCWSLSARYCRSASRFRYLPGYRLSYYGFRLCCSAGPRGQGTE